MQNFIFHASFGVKNTKVAAEAIAELTDGRVEVFETNADSSNVIWQGGQMLEVFPFETRLAPGEDAVSFTKEGPNSGLSATHFLIAVSLDSPQIKEIADRRGYTNRVAKRGSFETHDVWIENEFMLELLTAHGNK